MMNPTVAIEKLHFEFAGTRVEPLFTAILVGVVGSGNLEVMLEHTPHPHCEINIETSARGFKTIWEAVATDFHDRYQLAGVRVSINDMGATPAVVNLRLAQAVAQLRGAQA
jgi:malonate decarboxylase delta subunit